MKRLIAIAIGLAVGASTATPTFARESTKINRPENVEVFSSIGDTMVRVQLRENLPNAFGGADIFGRKRDRGVVFLTYFGIRNGKAVIRRRTIDIFSDETTMSRGGIGTVSGTATTFGSTTTVSGITTQAPRATVTPLPADTVELFVDPAKGGVLTVEDRIIEIVSADENTVRFKVRSNATIR